MNLTNNLCCRRLSFTNAASCPHCENTFSPGKLQAKSIAENKAFNRRAAVLILGAFLALPAALSCVQFQGYLSGTH